MQNTKFLILIKSLKCLCSIVCNLMMILVVVMKNKNKNQKLQFRECLIVTLITLSYNNFENRQNNVIKKFKNIITSSELFIHYNLYIRTEFAKTCSMIFLIYVQRTSRANQSEC